MATDNTLSVISPDGKKTRQSPHKSLLQLAESAEYFHDDEGTAWAIVPVNGHREVYKLISSKFERWLRRSAYEAKAPTPSKDDLSSALQILESQACYDKPQRSVNLRYAFDGQAIFLDLCNADWQAVKITKDGWSISDAADVPFRRASRSLPLPMPLPGGSIDELRDFLNPGLSITDFTLIKGWLIHTFMPYGGFVHLNLEGEQGAAKSTTTKVLKHLVDPSNGTLLPVPKREQDLIIAAGNSRILSFDNLSGLSKDLSDAFCRLSTGGGFQSRKLYTDDDEVVLEVKRPVIFTGIESIATRADLLDRSIIVTLPAISPENRRDEKSFWIQYEQRKPYILGALLDAVSEALRNIDNVSLEKLPRMADFVRWVIAAEEKMSFQEQLPDRMRKIDFIKVYERSRIEAADVAIESDELAGAVIALLERQDSFVGTPSQLIKEFKTFMELSKFFPSERKIRANLLRLKPALAQRQIKVSLADKKTSQGYQIGLERSSLIVTTP